MGCGEGGSSGVAMRRQNDEQMFHVKHSAAKQEQPREGVAKRELPKEWVVRREQPRGGVA